MTSPERDRVFYLFNAIVSIAAVALIAFVLMGPRTSLTGSADLRFMPGVNACLNALSASCVFIGVMLARRGRTGLHRYFMVLALVCSALFLIGYLAYHAVHGDTKFAGEGALRTFYLLLLASHVILSICVVPMIFTTVYFAIRKNHEKHKKIARVTVPIWLYVSVTGVVVFFMLNGSHP